MPNSNPIPSEDERRLREFARLTLLEVYNLGREAGERERAAAAPRFELFARLLVAHDGSHDCPQDDCPICWPGDVASELREYASGLRRRAEGE